MEPEPGYMSLAEAAAYTGLHPRTLHRRVADGSLPAVRVGGKTIRVKRTDVDALMTPVEPWVERKRWPVN